MNPLSAVALFFFTSTFHFYFGILGTFSIKQLLKTTPFVLAG